MICSRDVAVILVSYNPVLDNFIINLMQLLTQSTCIIVCDNSDNASISVQIELFCRETEGIIYLNMMGNKGIAYAQNRGVEHGISRGFSYFLELDQDTLLPANYVEDIINSYLQLKERGCHFLGVGSVAINAKNGNIYHNIELNKGFLIVGETLSSGFFYDKFSFNYVGGKNEDLFIDLVDWEWCWRAKQRNLATIVDTNLRINHFLGDGHRSFLGVKVGIPAPIRHYYQFRNALYLFGKPYVPFAWKVKRFIILMLKLPYYTFFSDRGIQRLTFIYKGCFDFLRSKFGKYDWD